MKRDLATFESALRIAIIEPPDNKPFHLTPGLAPCGRSGRRR